MHYDDIRLAKNDVLLVNSVKPPVRRKQLRLMLKSERMGLDERLDMTLT